MKIAVCIKQVPTSNSQIRIDNNSNWIHESNASFDINEPDNYALEEALQINEKNPGEVVLISLGPDRVQNTIRNGLAKGADRAIHIKAEESHNLDPLMVASVFANINKRENFDLILCGLQSDDQGYGQTGAALAEIIGIPHVSIVVAISIEDDGMLRVKCELESGWYQWMKIPVPALITIQSGINKPRYANIRNIMAAKNKEIKVELLSDILPANSSPLQSVSKIFIPYETKQTEILDGSPTEIVSTLINILHL